MLVLRGGGMIYLSLCIFALKKNLYVIEMTHNFFNDILYKQHDRLHSILLDHFNQKSMFSLHLSRGGSYSRNVYFLKSYPS
jgi:hypothetical protein